MAAVDGALILVILSYSSSMVRGVSMFLMSRRVLLFWIVQSNLKVKEVMAANSFISYS